ncbi:LCA5L protein, partial [Climacteris rufus]|nr:LCA5L protein [Climacteris rufus]
VYSALDAGGKKRAAAKTPYLNSSFLTLQSGVVYQDKNATAQRISSARLHKIKELKNEIFDLQRKIEASSLENQALKELSRRHAKAIDRYSNAESHLQELLARHRAEVQDLRKLLKMSQEAERNTSRGLRRVEAELRKAKSDLKTLAGLSEDKSLAEREELDHRLSVLNEMLEAKEERIQSLELQLKLNNSTFSRQLASENKKLLEVGIIIKNLIMEINCVHQKIKEKDRQLYIKNIYANRMPKILKDKGGLRVDRSVQVDKESFRELLLSQHQETGKSQIQLKKEKKSSEEKDEEAKANEASSDAQCRTEKQPTKKIPTSETSNRSHRGILLVEEHTFSAFMKEMEEKTAFLKQELKNLMRTEQSSQSDKVKQNNQEGDAVEEVGKEEKKTDEQLKKKAKNEGAIPNKEPIRLNNKYKFSKPVESLQHGLQESGPKSKAGSLCSLRQAGQGCSGEISFGVYEPSFGQTPLARQSTQVTLAERKERLMEELFGQG